MTDIFKLFVGPAKQYKNYKSAIDKYEIKERA